MRLFIGIPLADEVTRELSDLVSGLQRPGDDLRWSNPESWHITLQFLGSTTEPQFACLFPQLHTITAPPFNIALENVGFFDRAGVFFAGVQLSLPLLHLQQQVTAATAYCGFEAEDRPYHPHITLARNRGRSNGVRTLKPRVDRATRFTSFTAHEFLLYESFPGPSGSRYEIRASFSLEGQG